MLLRHAACWGAAAARTVVETLLPPHCLTCDALVDAPGTLCPDCFGATRFITGPECLSCDVPLRHPPGGAGLACAACTAQPQPWGEARAALVYDAQSRRLVLGLKHADPTELAAVLAQMMARAGVPCAALALRRVRATAPLGELSAAMRARVLDGAIAVRRPRDVAGRHVLLVDDALTSGATARACTLALLAAGVSGVDVLVAARVESKEEVLF